MCMQPKISLDFDPIAFVAADGKEAKENKEAKN